MKEIVIIGATGSIGMQTLSVIDEYPQEFRVVAFSVGFSDEFEICCNLIDKYSPKLVSCIEAEMCQELQKKYKDKQIKFVFGNDGLISVAEFKSDIFVNSVVGSVGLMPTLTAIKLGKRICLANKETLVVAGKLVMEMAKKYGAEILPIDSEHSAIYQCLVGEDYNSIKKIILTASGGSFRDKSRKDLVNVSVADALNHPNWRMGNKITIDSATMMNKGLEVIEAHHLFNVDYDNIEVIIHNESAIHSLVEFSDNSIKAQIATADMTLPIAYALSYPKRLITTKTTLDLVQLGKMHFNKVDFKRFPCLEFAFIAGKTGHSMPVVLNASNEIAVEAFLNEVISFIDIEKVIKYVMDQHELILDPTIEEIIKLDQEIRIFTQEVIKCQQY